MSMSSIFIYNFMLYENLGPFHCEIQNTDFYKKQNLEIF